MSKCDIWRFSVKIFIVPCKQWGVGDMNSHVTKDARDELHSKGDPTSKQYQSPGGQRDTGDGMAFSTFPLHLSGLSFIITDSTNVLFGARLGRLMSSLWSLQPSLQYLHSERPFDLSSEDIRFWQLRNVILKARTSHEENPGSNYPINANILDQKTLSMMAEGC